VETVFSFSCGGGTSFSLPSPASNHGSSDFSNFSDLLFCCFSSASFHPYLRFSLPDRPFCILRIQTRPHPADLRLSTFALAPPYFILSTGNPLCTVPLSFPHQFPYREFLSYILAVLQKEAHSSNASFPGAHPDYRLLPPGLGVVLARRFFRAGPFLLTLVSLLTYSGPQRARPPYGHWQPLLQIPSFRFLTPPPSPPII